MSVTEVCLVVIIALLGLLAILGYKAYRRIGVAVNPVAEGITDAIRQLDEAVRHHVDVTAVLALTENFRSDPELLRRLPEYAREVVGAALLYRLNSIGTQLQHAQTTLEAKRRLQASHASGTDARYYSQTANSVQQLVDDLLKKLRAAESDLQEFNRPRPVRT